MDTCKPTARITLTAGVRTTWNTDPVNQQRLFARPAGSFLDLSHNVSQPLDQAIRDAGAHTVSRHAAAGLAAARFRGLPSRAGHRAFISASASSTTLFPPRLRISPPPTLPTRQPLSAASAARWAALRIAPGVAGSAVDAAVQRQSQLPVGSSAPVPRPAPESSPGAPTCPLAVSLNTFPTGTLKTPYYYQYNFGIEQQAGAHGAVRIDYVGTRGLHEPFQVESERLPDRLRRMLCALSLRSSRSTSDSAASTNSAPTPTAATPACRPASPSSSAASRCAPTTPSAIASTRSRTAACSRFPRQGILSPLPGELSRQYGNCDYDVRHNISAFGIYQIPFRRPRICCARALRGWSFSETAFLHSGLPFTVLSQPYTANGNGVFQASGPQFARRVPGVPLYRKTPYSGVTVAGTRQWLNPEAFVSVVDPTTGACTGGDSPSQLPVRRRGPQHRARTALH